MGDSSNLQSKITEIKTRPMLHDEDWDDLNELITEVFISKNEIIETRPFEAEDFTTAPVVVRTCFGALEFLLSNVKKIDAPKSDSAQMKCIYSVIILCGEHSVKNLWTDDDCISLSKNILHSVLTVLQCNDMNSFLMKRDRKKKPYGAYIFELLLPKLSKESWKYFPAAVACYWWLLQYIKIPDMKEFVSLVLPVPLCILTDHTVENKVLGLTCLHHILTNLSSAELHWHIQIEVLFKILKPLFYYRETDLIVPLMKCALEVAEKDKPFQNVEVDLKWGFFDDVLTIFLPMMEFESNMESRCAYAESLSLILQRSNFAIGRWTARLLRIIEDYSKTPITELDACKTLNSYIRTCWPLAKDHWRLINVLAGRVIFRSSNEDAIKEAEHSIHLLKQLLPDNKEFLDVESIRERRRNEEES